RWLVESGHHVEERGLARSVRADQPDRFAPGDLDIESIKRNETVEAHREAAAGQQGRVHAFAPGRPMKRDRSRIGRGKIPEGRNSRMPSTSNAKISSRYS